MNRVSSLLILILLLFCTGLASAGTVEWSGIDWNSRDNQYTDPSCSWIDDSGNLHLKLEKINGVYQGALFESVDSFEYGTFSWTVKSSSLNLERGSTLGFFTYNDDGVYPLNEIDIEINQWPGYNERVWFVLQPGALSSIHEDKVDYSVARDIDDEDLKYSITWTPDEVHWSIEDSEGNIISEWKYTDSEDIQDDPARACFDLLVLNGGKGPGSGETIEVVLTDFEYIPYGEIKEPEKKPLESNGNIITVSSSGTNSEQDTINEAIKHVAEEGGGTVYLSGEFCINDPIILQSNVCLDGQGQTTITIPDNVNRVSSSEFYHKATKGYATVMVPFMKATNCENIEITKIHFDGNGEGQPDLITGRGFYNFIMPTGCNGISVHDCTGENSLGDFLRPIKCKNIKFYNIEAERLGHEALFAIRSSNIEMYGCKINCRINNAFRIRGSDNAYIHDNYVTCTAKESAGPGGQVDVIENQEMNVEICNNVFVSTGGPGLWIVGDNNNYNEDLTNIKIHHNAFLNTGWDGRDWQGGVLTSVVHNVDIYNNVFDGCSNSGVVTYRVKGLPVGPSGADFTITVKDNIITNTHKGKNSGSGVGYGLSNTLSQSHNLISSGNVFWDNAGGNYNKCSGNDLVQDPKLDPASTGWRWTGSAWECDYVSADVDVWDSEEEVDEEIEEEDYEPVPEREFDSIFEILNSEFTDTGNTGQTSDDIDYTVEKTTRGYVAGGIKIVGFGNLIYIDGVPYIPDEDSMIVKYAVIRSPDLDEWIGHIKKIDKEVKKEIKDGTAYATLIVKTSWYTIKTDKVTGERKTSKTKVSTSTFEDSCPAYDILKREKISKAYVNVFDDSKNPIAKVRIAPTNTTQRIEVTYGDNSTTRTLMIGERITGEDSIKYTSFSRCDIWEGSIPHMGNELIIYEKFNEDKLKIVYYTPYESYQVDNIEIIYHKNKGESQLFITLKFIAQFLMAMFAGYKIMKIIIN